ncbi:MAG: hypothetical protein ACPGVD_11905 [Flavobacteriales bacterium]
MKFLYLYSFILTLFLLGSCKKDLNPLQDNIGTPEFFVSGDLDTALFNFEAGNNDYYMETNFVQERDGNGNPLPISLRSYLSIKGLPNSRNSVSIFVMNTNYDTTYSNFKIDSVFYVGKRIPLTSDSLNNINLFTPNKALIRYNSGISSSDYSFYSSTVVQGNVMIITAVEPYRNNRYNQKTVKVSFELICGVTDITRTPIKSLTLKGTFAFAYPS